MLDVTRTAVEELSAVLAESGVQTDQGLRLVHEGEGRMALTLDSVHEGDQVIEDGTRAVLFVEPVLSESLDGSTLDAVPGPQGAELRLIVPEGDEAGPGA